MRFSDDVRGKVIAVMLQLIPGSSVSVVGTTNLPYVSKSRRTRPRFCGNDFARRILGRFA